MTRGRTAPFFNGERVVLLLGSRATALDGPCHVVVGGLVRFQGRSAGVIDAHEAEPATCLFLDLVHDAAAALDAGVAKSLHCSSSFFFVLVILMPFWARKRATRIAEWTNAPVRL